MIEICINRSLSDRYPVVNAKSCEVTEERNGKYELNLECAVVEETTGRSILKDLEEFGIIYAKPNKYDPAQFFHVDSVESDGYTLKAHANHESIMLDYYPVEPMSLKSSISAVAQSLPSNIPYYDGFLSWDFSGDGWSTRGGSAFATKEVMSVRGLLLSACEYFDAELHFDGYRVVMRAPNNSYGTVNDAVKFTKGVNIVSLEYEANTDDTFNGIYPYWTDGLTLVKPSSVSEIAGNKIPYKKWDIRDISSMYNTTPTVANMNSASSNMKSSINADVKHKISAKVHVEEEQADKIHLGDMCVIEYEGIFDEQLIELTSYTYDVIADRYTEINLGQNTSLDATLVEQERASKIYTINVKPGPYDWFDFTFTRCGKWVTVQQNGNSNIPAWSALASFGNWIPLGYRPAHDCMIDANEYVNNVKRGHCSYVFRHNGDIQYWANTDGVADRSFTLAWSTDDPYPRK